MDSEIVAALLIVGGAIAGFFAGHEFACKTWERELEKRLARDMHEHCLNNGCHMQDK